MLKRILDWWRDKPGIVDFFILLVLRLAGLLAWPKILIAFCAGLLAAAPVLEIHHHGSRASTRRRLARCARDISGGCRVRGHWFDLGVPGRCGARMDVLVRWLDELVSIKCRLQHRRRSLRRSGRVGRNSQAGGMTAGFFA